MEYFSLSKLVLIYISGQVKQHYILLTKTK